MQDILGSITSRCSGKEECRPDSRKRRKSSLRTSVICQNICRSERLAYIWSLSNKHWHDYSKEYSAWHQKSHRKLNTRDCLRLFVLNFVQSFPQFCCLYWFKQNGIVNIIMWSRRLEHCIRKKNLHLRLDEQSNFEEKDVRELQLFT